MGDTPPLPSGTLDIALGYKIATAFLIGIYWLPIYFEAKSEVGKFPNAWYVLKQSKKKTGKEKFGLTCNQCNVLRLIWSD